MVWVVDYFNKDTKKLVKNTAVVLFDGTRVSVKNTQLRRYSKHVNELINLNDRNYTCTKIYLDFSNESLINIGFNMSSDDGNLTYEIYFKDNNVKRKSLTPCGFLRDKPLMSDDIFLQEDFNILSKKNIRAHLKTNRAYKKFEAFLEKYY